MFTKKYIIFFNRVRLQVIFSNYKVVLPYELENCITKSFYYPDEKPQNAAVQKLRLSSPNMVHLFVKVSVTLRQIVDLHNQLECFLTPIMPFLHFLEHFHLNESQIFDSFVKMELKEYFEVSIYKLTEILKTVKKKIQSILTGAAIYNDIDLAGIAFHFGKKSNTIPREIRIVSDYEEFQSISSHDTVRSFKNIFVLHQIAEHIDALGDFCDEFELQQCLEDSRVKRLKEIVEARESWKMETIRTLSDIVKEIQELLGIKPESDFKNLNFLRLFRPLYTETKDLRDFLTENNFRGKGKDRFLELFNLVTQAHQHDEYNAEVLNPLYAVYYLLVPLNKPDLSFQELIDEVSKLDSAQCLAQLKTVKSNIDLIRMWFSKAEVRF